MVKLFIDSADVAEIQWAYDMGVVCGVTTNPLFLDGSKEKLQAVISVTPTADPISVQVRGTGETWLADAKGVLNLGSRMLVKVPCCEGGIRLVKRLWTDRAAFNVTGVMSPAQAIVAAASGAGFVSVFWCRAQDADEYPPLAIKLAKSEGAKVIVGSIRDPLDVVRAAQAGADYVTVPPKILRAMFSHSKTEEFIAQCAKGTK